MEELSVSEFISQLNELMVPVKPPMVTEFVNSILERRHRDPSTPAPKVGQNWLGRFLERHTELFVEDQRKISLEGKSSRALKDIQRWLERFDQVITTNIVEPQDEYSYCEANFEIGAENDQWVIRLNPNLDNKGESDASSNNCEHVRVSEVVSGDGSVLPPLIIPTSSQAHQSWAEGLESRVSLVVSDGGCCSIENPSCRWFRHFDHHSFHRQKGEYRLFLMPNHDTHSSPEFLSYCEEKKIILLF